METLWMLLFGVVALGVVVFLHELGHFTLAKIFKIKVLTFSLGFGKKLVGCKRGETEYVISALPLGGYVKMAGENPQEADGQPARPGDFFYQAWWKRLAVTLAGPLMNWLSAALIFALVFWRGFEVPLALPQVVEVMPNSPAQASELLPGDVITALEEQPLLNWEKFETLLNQTMEKQQAGGLKLIIRRRGSEEKLLINPEKDPASKRWRIGIVMAPAATTIVDKVFVGTPAEIAGLQKGDQISAVQNEPVWSQFDFQQIIKRHLQETVTLTVERNGQQLAVDIKPIEQSMPGKQKMGVIGVNFLVSPNKEIVRFPLPRALATGFFQTAHVTTTIITSLGQMITGKISAKDSVGGPITIMRMAGQEARSGLKNFLFFVASISIMLAIINLLPVPVLDGGNAVFFILEGLMRRPLSMKIQERAQRIGFALLIALMIFATYNDISKIVLRFFKGA